MTQEDKDLVMKDLCARLPYGVKFRTLGGEFPFTLKWIDRFGKLNGDLRLENAQIFLRPMSSMTEKEMTEYKKLSVLQPINNGYDWHEVATIDALDWLNAHHFDYRGLIEKGLAISTEIFNPYKD